jgi:hypothetical protein
MFNPPNTQDATCNVEAVETANTAQLNTILMQLSNTTYFRLWKVKMDMDWCVCGGGEGDMWW